MFSVLIFLLVILAVFSVGLAHRKQNEWPIIGVFTQPTSSTEGDCGGNCLYLASSYVKYLEASGARVAPIMYDATKEELDRIFEGVNGIFFPGGGAEFPEGAQYLFDRAIEANDKGDFFPMWGTCMGFQWLLISTSRDTNILDPKDGTVMDSYNYTIPLEFTKKAQDSRLFGSASRHIMDVLATQNVTMNNHHYGIWTDHFYQTPSLYNFFDVLSVNRDKNNLEFVSTIEAKKYPIYGSQWHPEKNNFEWGKEDDGIPKEGINHSYNAVEVSQFTANFFIQEARKNFHSFPTYEEEDKSLIYNYKPTYTHGSFIQTYFFPFKK